MKKKGKVILLIVIILIVTSVVIFSLQFRKKESENAIIEARTQSSIYIDDGLTAYIQWSGNDDYWNNQDISCYMFFKTNSASGIRSIVEETRIYDDKGNMIYDNPYYGEVEFSIPQNGIYYGSVTYVIRVYDEEEDAWYNRGVSTREFDIGTVTKIDRTPPTISTALKSLSKTTNSATVSIGATDSLSGFSQVEWYYKKSTDSGYTLYTTDTTVPMHTYNAGATSEVAKTKTIDRLTAGTTYNIKAKVYDVAGNSTESSVVTVTLDPVPTLIKDNNVTFTTTPTGWTQGPVTVKATTTISGYTLQVSGDNKNWQDKDTTSRALNGAVYARLTDGINAGGSATINITNIDPTKPTVTLSQNGGNYVMPTSGNATIKTKITATDEGGSGLSQLQYGWSQSNTTSPTNWTTFTNGQEISKSDITAPGNWYLWTNVTDGAGNKATTVKTSNAFVVGANTESANNITFNLSTTDWTNGTVKVTPTYGANLTQNKTLTSNGTAVTDYVLNGTTEVTAKTNGITITATAQDIAGNTVRVTKTITNIDKELPTVELEPDGGNYIVQNNVELTIKAKLVATDVGGSDINTLKYAWSQSNIIEPTEWENATNNQEIRKTGMSNVEKWYLWVKVTDNAGNENTQTSKVFRFVRNESEFDTNTVTYNYTENEGTSVTKEIDYKKKDEKVDLSVTAQKTGYEFVGWNTNKGATTALSEFTMGEEDITLYAIFKKEIKLQFVDYEGTKQVITTKTLTIYNNHIAKTTTPTINEYTGWTTQYWTTGEEADAPKAFSEGEEITNIAESATYYARYSKTSTIKFNLNGGQGAEVADIKNNVEVNSKNINVVKSTKVTIPQITSTKEGYKAVCWNTKADGSGIDYIVGESLDNPKDMTLYIRWERTVESGGTEDEPITVVPEITVDKPEGWTNKGIAVKITQVSGEGKIKRVTVNGTEIQAVNSEYSYEIKENGTYTIEIEDENNNTIRKEITITSIDKTAPVISNIENSSKEEVQTEVIVELKLQDNDSGVAKVEYSYDGNTWNDCLDESIQKDFIVTSYSYQAGESTISMKWIEEIDKTIYFRVTDNIGNVSEVKSTKVKLNNAEQPDVPDKDNPSNPTNPGTSNGDNIQSSNGKKDDTIAPGILPNTGNARIIILIASVLILTIVSIILLKKYKLLKEIIK